MWQRNLLVILGVLALVIAGGLYLWQITDQTELPDGGIFGNGRVEGTEVKIAAKYPGRIVEIGPEEGDDVVANAILVRLDDREPCALLAEARAEYNRVSHVAHSARADVERSESELGFAEDQLNRTRRLRAEIPAPSDL